MDLLSGFDEAKFKPYLKMATQRMQIAVNKKTQAVKLSHREIAKMLEAGKDEKAAIKVEAVIREDSTIEALGILELIADLLFERSRLIAAEKECPEDLKSAIHTLIWAANRADIGELHEAKKQFIKRYGREWVARAESNQDHLVNERVIAKMSIRPPSATLVDKYLMDIAQKNGIDWQPSEPTLSQEEMAWNSHPIPNGFSVPTSQFDNQHGKPDTVEGQTIVRPPAAEATGRSSQVDEGRYMAACGGGGSGVPIVQAIPYQPSEPRLNVHGVPEPRPVSSTSSMASEPLPRSKSPPMADAIPM